MEIGALSSGLLTGLREGVEAALIVSIVLAYLARTGNLRFASRIWLGVVAAVLLSAGLGVLLYITVGNLPQPYEQVFEGATLLAAAGSILLVSSAGPGSRSSSSRRVCSAVASTSSRRSGRSRPAARRPSIFEGCSLTTLAWARSCEPSSATPPHPKW